MNNEFDLKIHDQPKDSSEFYSERMPTFEEYLYSIYPNGNYEAIKRRFELENTDNPELLGE